MVLALTSNQLPNRNWIFASVVVYMSTLVALTSLLKWKGLREWSVRIPPDVLDVAAISVLVRVTGGGRSAWYLLYLLPILSGARYLGPPASIIMVALIAFAYLSLGRAIHGAEAAPWHVVMMRILVFGAVSMIATNLARTKHRADAAMIGAIERIDSELLGSGDLDQVMREVLKAAMEMTASDLSVIVLEDQGRFIFFRSSQDDATASVVAFIRERYHELMSGSESNSEAGIALPGSPWPGRLIPLRIRGQALGVLGVFSRRPAPYYATEELRRLNFIAPLVAMAQQNAKFYRAYNVREEERKNHLQMLIDIGNKLKSEQGLDQLYQDVVRLISRHVNCEEAALFLAEGPKRELRKVAFTGLSEPEADELQSIEFYTDTSSLTGSVFHTKCAKLTNSISSGEPCAQEYARCLKSGKAQHYMGAPLLIDDEVLGVIRVINKKSIAFSKDNSLEPMGFAAEELQLLQTIATQIASAIRSGMFIEQNRSFRNLIYNSPDPIIVLDKDGKILHFNRQCERIWGWKETQIIGKSAGEFYASATLAKDISKRLRALADHTITDFRAEIRHANGELIPILLSATMFVDKQGRRSGSIGVFKDEREMIRRQEEELSAARLADLGRFAHTIGHDIKHDLGTVLNYLEVLDSGVRMESNPEALLAIRESTLEALEKLQRLNMAARPARPEAQPIELRDLVDSIKFTCNLRAKATKIEFQVSSPPLCNPLEGDLDQLKQVFSNLLGNSIDAIEIARMRNLTEQGRILLTMHAEQSAILFEWEDNGCGIPDNIKNRVFTPFFTTKETGSGLGLFITKTIIENHGGTISVQEVTGGGTRFTITLPIGTAMTTTNGVSS